MCNEHKQSHTNRLFNERLQNVSKDGTKQLRAFVGTNFQQRLQQLTQTSTELSSNCHSVTPDTT